MELRKLRYFVRVAEDGSLTRSAGVLRVAQPALSRQMRLLEEELGLKLFARTARGMQLTEDGSQLHAAIAAPLRELELALDNARAGARQPTGTLVIGLAPGLADLLAAPMAALMAREFPGVVPRLVEGPTGSLVDWLNRGAVDFAFLEETARDSRIEEQALREEPLWLVGPAAAGLGARGPVALEEAARLALVIPSHHLGIRAAIDDACARAGLAVQARLYADTPRLMCQLVREEGLFTILPESYFRHAARDAGLSGCPLAQADARLGLWAARRRKGRVREDRISLIARRLVALAQERLAGEAGSCVVGT